MTQQESKLWTKIQAFQFSEKDTTFPFEARLARENNWTIEFTERVIEEYRRFMFLCCISKKIKTPSDEVDQVWHLHMIYTKSYWEDFCQNTLGQLIHHNPTKGGHEEREKFWELYENTKIFYREKFGEKPPEDIWLPTQERFSKINFKRVHFDDYWLIKKPSRVLRNQLAFFMVLVAGTFSVAATNTSIPLNYSILALTITVIGLLIFRKFKILVGFLILLGGTLISIYLTKNTENLALALIVIGCFGGGLVTVMAIFRLRAKESKQRKTRQFIGFFVVLFAVILGVITNEQIAVGLGIVGMMILVFNINYNVGSGGGSNWGGCAAGCGDSDSGCGSGCGGCGGCGG